MARIPEDELERIKREADLVRLVRGRGVELKPYGKDLVGRCIFHGPDETPSLVVSPDKQLYHCFACNAAGDAIEWVMKTEGVSFRHAVEILKNGGPPPALGASPVKRSTVRRLAAPVELSAADHELLAQVVEYYHSTLLAAPEAQEYLKKRGIADPDVVRAFTLGFANRTLGLRLPDRRRSDGLRMRHRLTQLGILRATTGHEHFNGSLVIPVFDEQGRVVEIYGRKIRDDLREGTAYHTYLPGPHRGVWNVPALRSSKEIILCEALIDALTFYCAGFANVTASYGVNGFTADHLEAMKTHGTERVLLAYDRDDAGDRAAEELAKRLAAEGIASFRVRFPHGLDANAYACKVQPAAQSLAVLLRSAEYLAGPLTARPQARGGSREAGGETRAEGRGLRAEGHPPAQEESQEPASPLAAVSPTADDADAIDISDMVEVIEPDETQPPRAPTAPASPSPEPSALSPASPVPPAPRAEVSAEVSEHQVVMRFGDRHWRIRGLGRNLSFETMRVNLFVGLDGHPERFHQDTLDLYAAKQRAAFTRTAASELGLQEDTVKRDLGAVLLKLEELQEAAIKQALAPKEKAVVIAEPDRAAALALLRDPRLLDRILDDFERCGVIGEESNKLMGYLAAISRKLEQPLAVMVQSSSAAGKSALMNAVLAFVPDEERVAYSAMTGQSLFYMSETDLEHKVLAIAEEEGAQRASYALKQLQSEGALSIASTGKDPATGRLVTHEYRVEGPAALFMTTTAIDLDEELLNRCLVLTVNEDREQTRAIHRMQRESQTIEGIVARRRRAALLVLHRNAQRLLRPLPIFNPYARHLTFLDDSTRMRRDHLKYLGLIAAITLLRQYQREHRVLDDEGERVEHLVVALDDIAEANRLAHEVLGHTLDELPPQTRRFLTLLEQMVREACTQRGIGRAELRFTRAEARRATNWSLTQVRLHLDRLVEMEYVVIHKGGRGQSFVYELLYSGQGHDGERFLLGLIDVDTLRSAGATHDPNLAGFSGGVADEKGQVAGSKRGQDGAKTGEWRVVPEPEGPNGNGHREPAALQTSLESLLGNEPTEPPSHVAPGRSGNDDRREEGGGRREQSNGSNTANEEEAKDEELLSLAAASHGSKP